MCFYFEFDKTISVEIKPYFLKYPFAKRTKLVKAKKRTLTLITYAGEQESVSGQRQEGCREGEVRYDREMLEHEMRGVKRGSNLELYRYGGRVGMGIRA